VKISKEAVEQFEEIRAMGPCNMLDRRCVQEAANDFDYYDLAILERDEYLFLVRNYSQLMKHYGIKRVI
jgi:hypothetical protein